MLAKRDRRQYINDLIYEKAEGIKKVDLDMFQEEFCIDDYRSALLNSVKLFLLSRKGDRIRRPDYAGFFDKLLSEYEMTEEGASQVEQDLTKRLNEFFGDELSIQDVKAKPILAEEGWEIGVTAIDPETHIVSSADTDTIFLSIKQENNFRPGD